MVKGGMFHNQGNTSDTQKSPFQKGRALLPLVKGAGGILNGIREMLSQSFWKMRHP
jgi:hypothetical protein